MDQSSLSGHYLEKYNEELETLRRRVLNMGNLVERQVANAVKALTTADTALADEVIQEDVRVNSMEVAIDEHCSEILARHQPAASDLRFILAIIKTITDLERIGDQAERVARMAVHLAEKDRPRNQYGDVQALGEKVTQLVHNAVDAFARLDVDAAVATAREDVNVDRDYEAVMRQHITFMMEDPRTISRALDVVWAIRALERVGDHSRNMCEYVIYLVRGKDVRHISLDEMEQVARGGEPEGESQ
ncbi:MULTISPECIES: phosphate signaling complex protein PhoU [Ectothiorhodospira]|uniref:phosphate signaling complex protein PhoU n=1 Tax=Ectothiorhodospira TaxID=1051 RepID=UPI001EE80F8D|nr:MULTISPECIES: phosphate signaling complex protein PhoU [Ectothiorhodospira]MCG5493621.1 phosphate signaling complex protein PhoU [Ectothiorhodospira variabilis]MCG5496969.1 phosphate signaling complex protein PhoU [Ectothiorhodospira variabilis]MCG5502950.1 phosphate signaling complex protein PhoU [Ectothiorhodospira variabilis]MCG5506262.1 phosphate signaling complex protein PhoU [Ectothiorhodospira variabilis]MCG5525112.1 phosphate signaling complex protein PhoU [Ectothiorhodospira haloal